MATRFGGARPQPDAPDATEDGYFKVRRGLDVSGGRIRHINLTPVDPHEVASKDYVDRLAGGGPTGITQTSGDGRYLQLAGGQVTGQVLIPEPVQPASIASKGYVDGHFIELGSIGGLRGLTPQNGSLAYVRDTAQLYTYTEGTWVGVTTLDNPQATSGAGSGGVPGAGTPPGTIPPVVTPPVMSDFDEGYLP
jgi:hypothetical protein